ncbi:hypothetical protein BDF21DRAFT_413483 [Thamnidium elegans]|nr:hypothetical protein BDF21DRAFT_413483 [Thamnidium elegans]
MGSFFGCIFLVLEACLSFFYAGGDGLSKQVFYARFRIYCQLLTLGATKNKNCILLGVFQSYKLVIMICQMITMLLKPLN